MKQSIIERFLLWIMPLSPLETLIMLLLNEQEPFALDSYRRNKIEYLKMILNNEQPVLAKKFPVCYTKIGDRGSLDNSCYYSWYRKRKTRFIISMAIIRIFNVHFKSLHQGEYTTVKFKNNFDLPTNTLIDIFGLIITYSIFTNNYLSSIFHPDSEKGSLRFERYMKEVKNSFSLFVIYDYKHLCDRVLSNTPIGILIGKYMDAVTETFLNNFKEAVDADHRKRQRKQYSRSKRTTGAGNTLGRYFDILNIKPTGDKEVIKRAYRKMAALHHPDRSKDPQSEFKMKNVNIAYNALKQALDF